MTHSEYFANVAERDRNRPVLKRRRRPCHDCAVTCGLYSEFSIALKTMPHELQKSVSEKWFCHNDPTKSCEGNWRVIEDKPVGGGS